MEADAIKSSKTRVHTQPSLILGCSHSIPGSCCPLFLPIFCMTNAVYVLQFLVTMLSINRLFTCDYELNKDFQSPKSPQALLQGSTLDCNLLLIRLQISSTIIFPTLFSRVSLRLPLLRASFHDKQILLVLYSQQRHSSAPKKHYLHKSFK